MSRPSRFLPYPHDTDDNGEHLYFLDMRSGELITHKPTGRRCAAGLFRNPKGRALKGEGRYGIVQLIGERGKPVRRTRKALILEILNHHWGL